MSKFLSRSNYRNEKWTEHPAFPIKAVQYRDWIRERHMPKAELQVYELDLEAKTCTFIPEERWHEFLVSR